MMCELLVLGAVYCLEVVFLGEYGCYGLGYFALGVYVFKEIFVSVA